MVRPPRRQPPLPQPTRLQPRGHPSGGTHQPTSRLPAKHTAPPKTLIVENKTTINNNQVNKTYNFARLNERTGAVWFEPRWWYSFVEYPAAAGGSAAGGSSWSSNFDTVEPPPGVLVTPPVIRAGQGLPLARGGQSLLQVLNSMDVEQHWLPGRKVNWRTGTAELDGPPSASNAGAFVAAVCSRLTVPVPGTDLASFEPTRQQDWLRTDGKNKGWVAVGTLEAQLLANQGWVVVATWRDPASSHGPFGHAAIVRPDSKPANEIPRHGPRLTQAGTRNFNSVWLKDAFPAKAWEREQVVYFAHRPG